MAVNWQRGLERISAVWWGLFGLAGVLLLGAAVLGQVSSGANEAAAWGTALIIGAYTAHRITCWIFAGFFTPRL